MLKRSKLNLLKLAQLLKLSNCLMAQKEHPSQGALFNVLFFQ